MPIDIALQRRARNVLRRCASGECPQPEAARGALALIEKLDSAAGLTTPEVSALRFHLDIVEGHPSVPRSYFTPGAAPDVVGKRDPAEGPRATISRPLTQEERERMARASSPAPVPPSRRMRMAATSPATGSAPPQGVGPVGTPVAQAASPPVTPPLEPPATFLMLSFVFFKTEFPHDQELRDLWDKLKLPPVATTEDRVADEWEKLRQKGTETEKVVFRDLWNSDKSAGLTCALYGYQDMYAFVALLQRPAGDYKGSADATRDFLLAEFARKIDPEFLDGADPAGAWQELLARLPEPLGRFGAENGGRFVARFALYGEWHEDLAAWTRNNSPTAPAPPADAPKVYARADSSEKGWDRISLFADNNRITDRLIKDFLMGAGAWAEANPFFQPENKLILFQDAAARVAYLSRAYDGTREKLEQEQEEIYKTIQNWKTQRDSDRLTADHAKEVQRRIFWLGQQEHEARIALSMAHTAVKDFRDYAPQPPIEAHWLAQGGRMNPFDRQRYAADRLVEALEARIRRLEYTEGLLKSYRETLALTVEMEKQKSATLGNALTGCWVCALGGVTLMNDAKDWFVATYGPVVWWFLPSIILFTAAFGFSVPAWLLRRHEKWDPPKAIARGALIGSLVYLAVSAVALATMPRREPVATSARASPAPLPAAKTAPKAPPSNELGPATPPVKSRNGSAGVGDVRRER